MGKWSKEKVRPIISPPSNFEHTVHVDFDPMSGEFVVSLENYSDEIFYFVLFPGHAR